MELLLEAEKLNKTYCRRTGDTVAALTDISFFCIKAYVLESLERVDAERVRCAGF